MRVLGTRVDRLSRTQILERIRRLAASGRPHQIITANTLMLLAAERDAELQGVIEGAALVTAESSGLRLAGWRMRRPFPSVIPGIDLFVELCAAAAADRHPIFLLGARPGVAEAVARVLLNRFPGLAIAGTHHGYFQRPPHPTLPLEGGGTQGGGGSEEDSVIRRIRESGAVYCFVALTVPGQEKWIARHLQELKIPVVMGVGGSFDVLSGRLSRAPQWMQKAGLEWAYRFYQEPWRWTRIAQLPVFAWKILTATHNREQ